MAKEKVFHLEDLEIPVPMFLDERFGQYLYDYPIFSTKSKYTGSGHLCVNAFQEACENIKPDEGITVKSMDCGCCVYYQTEQEKDLIGVCMCEKNQIIKRNQGGKKG